MLAHNRKKKKKKEGVRGQGKPFRFSVLFPKVSEGLIMFIRKTEGNLTALFCGCRGSFYARRACRGE